MQNVIHVHADLKSKDQYPDDRDSWGVMVSITDFEDGGHSDTSLRNILILNSL